MNYTEKFKPKKQPFVSFYSTNCAGKQEHCKGYIYEKERYYFIDYKKVCEGCALRMGRVCASCGGVKPVQFPYCFPCAEKNKIIGIPPKGYER